MIEDAFASMRSVSDLLEARLDQKLALMIQIGIINDDIAKCKYILQRLEENSGRLEKACKVCGDSFVPRSRTNKTCQKCAAKAHRDQALRMNELRATRSAGPRAVPFKKAVGE